jgi:hypothetical protein
MFQDTADPKIRGRLEITQTDFFADQIAGLSYAPSGIQKDKAVSEAAVEKNRDGGKRQVGVFRH